MSYTGQTYSIPCDQGGLVHNPNIDMILPTDMVWPSKNINLHENGRKKRGGTDKVYDAGLADTPTIRGIFDFQMVGGTQYIISACSDGKVYYDDTNTLTTGMSTTTFFDFEVLDDELYIVDGNTVPKLWTGSGSASALTDIPTDWTGTNFPQWIVKHGSGVSQRLWAGGCPETPHVIYISPNNDGDDFSDANVTTLSIETGDGFGIVGAIEFGDRLICFGKTRSYIIDDSDTDTSNWGYLESQWKGGTANFRTLIRTPNDIISVMEDGSIYSVVTAEQYGDYKVASLSRKAFIDRWIREYVNLAQFDKIHGVYDPVTRSIRIFMVKSGHTNIDMAVIYFIDRPPEAAWIVHDNESYDSGYNAASSTLIRESAGVFKVYTGDYSGDLWELETTSQNDDDNEFWAGFNTPRLTLDNPRYRKNFKRGFIATSAEGNYDLEMDIWVDGYPMTSQSISMQGIGGVLPFTLGTDLLGGNEMIDSVFPIGQNGKRINFQVYNDTVDEDFFISQILLDHKVLGAKPA